jgi:hypothetical protein
MPNLGFMDLDPALQQKILDAQDNAQKNDGDVGQASVKAFDENTGADYQPDAPANVPTYPGYEGSESGTLDNMEGDQLANHFNRYMSPYISTGVVQQPVIQQAGEDYAPLGGAQGRDVYNEAFVKAPAEARTALQDAASKEAEFHDARATTIGNLHDQQAKELASLEERRKLNEAYYAQKQAQLEQAGQRYAADLADRGQWWHSPGNIISAFVSSLMNLGSDDPMAGHKVIMANINSDWQKRKELADYDMSNQRTNLGAYRQMIGDNEMADRQSMLDNYKVAMMELDRLSSQFAGPIAKSKAQAQIKLLQAEAAKVQALMYRAAVYQPAKPTSKPMLDAQRIEGAALPGVGWQQYGQKPGEVSNKIPKVPGLPDGLPTTTDGLGSSVRETKPPVQDGSSAVNSGTANPSSQASGRGVLPDNVREAAEKRVPGINATADQERHYATQGIFAEVGADPTKLRPGMTDEQIEALVPPAKRPAFNAKQRQFEKDRNEDFKVISQQASPVAERINSYRRLAQDIGQIEAASKVAGVNPDDLLSTNAKQVFGSGNVKTVREYLLTRGVENPTEEQAKAAMRAVSAFDQTVAGVMNEYGHGKFGGNLSPGEQKRLDQFVSHHDSFGSLKNFQQQVSGDAMNFMDTVLNGSKYPSSKLLWQLKSSSNPRRNINYPGVPEPRTELNMQAPRMPTEHKQSPISSKPGAVGTSEDPEVQRAIENLQTKLGGLRGK